MNIYISPTGSATGNGTLDKPVDTPTRALELARERRSQGDTAELRFLEGTYSLDTPLTLDARDSGTEEAPFVIRAEPGHKVAISAGTRLDAWSETTVNGATAWVTDIPEADPEGGWNFQQLFVNGERRFRPRLPKKGFHRFDRLTGGNSGMNWYKGPDNVAFKPGDIENWQNVQDVGLVVYQLWFDTHHRIKEVDMENHIVHFQSISPGSLMDETGQMARYYIENVFEALSDPGEWYLNRAEKKLYYLPMEGESLDDVEIIAPRHEQIVRFEGTDHDPVQHVHIENLILQHADWVPDQEWTGSIQACYHVPGAVSFRHARHCALYGCEIAHIAHYGVQFSNGSHDCRAIACHIHDMGAGGARMDHEWNEKSWRAYCDGPRQAVEGALPRAAVLTDCSIHDGGVLYPSAVGVWIGNAGHNQVLHNHIYNMNYTGISCGWVWGYAPTATEFNRIEHNHIHHINWDPILSDNGAVYTLGIQPGSVIRNNYIHHVGCYGYGGWGIYPDEGSSEILIENNVVHDTKNAGFSVHYSRDLVVRNNIFARGGQQQVLGANRIENHRSAIFERNLITFDRDAMTGQGYSGSSYKPEVSRFSDTLIWASHRDNPLGEKTSIDELEQSGVMARTVQSDPRFADPEGGDFSMPSDSPAWATGYESIDLGDVGPRLDGRRSASYTDWPHNPDSALPPCVQTLLEQSAPDKIRLTLKNRGDSAASGSLRLVAAPSGVVDLIDDEPVFTYQDLQPGETVSCEYTLKNVITKGYGWVETLPLTGEGLIPTLVKISVDHELKIPVIPELPGAAGIFSVLDTMAVRKRERSRIYLAESGEGLAIGLDVSEPEIRVVAEQPWTGSSAQLFVASCQPALSNLQLIIAPDPEHQRVRVLLPEGNDMIEQTEISSVCERTDTGYRLGLLLPYAALPIDSPRNPIPLDMTVSIFNPEKDEMASEPLFEDATPFKDASEYGRLIVENGD